VHFQVILKIEQYPNPWYFLSGVADSVLSSIEYALVEINTNPINPKDRITNFFNNFVFIIFNLIVDKNAPEDFLI
jgi:hypothetical protein